ncbi:hypothetical protein B0T41_21690 [Chromobacterium violaceum]|nr:hypothetical protein B0T41_21690 [Chromobacterium violaceum]
MSKLHFPEEFKIEAVKQVTERGYPVSEVASRLSVSTHSLELTPFRGHIISANW